MQSYAPTPPHITTRATAYTYAPGPHHTLTTRAPHHEEHEDSAEHHPCCAGVVITIRVGFLHVGAKVQQACIKI